MFKSYVWSKCVSDGFHQVIGYIGSINDIKERPFWLSEALGSDEFMF